MNDEELLRLIDFYQQSRVDTYRYKMGSLVSDKALERLLAYIEQNYIPRASFNLFFRPVPDSARRWSSIPMEVRMPELFDDQGNYIGYEAEDWNEYWKPLTTAERGNELRMMAEYVNEQENV